MRNNKWVIWQSSYDRGLSHLLEIWDDVVKEVPDAQLHIFYGWTLFERFYKDNPERMAWKAEMDRMMDKPSIVHHGRVPQKEMQSWIERCGIWAFPCHFYEISCISAMRSQIGGAIPVCTDFAALESTVQYGVKVSGDIYDPEVLEKFKQELIAMLKDENKQEEIRKEMIPWAKQMFTWTRVGEQWSNLFKKGEADGLIPTKS